MASQRYDILGPTRTPPASTYAQSTITAAPLKAISRLDAGRYFVRTVVVQTTIPRQVGRRPKLRGQGA